MEGNWGEEGKAQYVEFKNIHYALHLETLKSTDDGHLTFDNKSKF